MTDHMLRHWEGKDLDQLDHDGLREVIDSIVMHHDSTVMHCAGTLEVAGHQAQTMMERQRDQYARRMNLAVALAVGFGAAAGMVVGSLI